MRRLILLIMLSAPALVATRATASDTVLVVDLPKNGAPVPWRACVVGRIVNPIDTPIVVLHPVQTGDYWVGPAVTLFDEGRQFRVWPYFGDNGRAHVGARYEVLVVSGPTQRLREGQVLNYWPDAKFRSEVIEVIRDDRAGPGCDLKDTDPLPSSPSARVSAGSAAASPPTALGGGPIAGRASEPWPRPTTSAATWPRLSSRQMFVTFLLIFVVLAICPRHARRLQRWLDRWVRWGTQALVALLSWTRRAFADLMQGTLSRTSAMAEYVWRARGVSLTVRGWVMAFMRFAALLPSVALLTLIDALVIRSGLALVLPAPARTGGLLDSIGLDAPHTADAAHGLLPAAGESPLRTLAGLIAPLWDDMSGLAAVGLAFAQAVFGIALLLGSSSSEAVATTPPAMWRRRPVPVALFAILNFTLALLAWYRAYELSSEAIAPFLPATLAFLIALVTPLLLAYALHLLFESAADVLAIAGTIVGFAAICVAGSAFVVAAFVSLFAIAAVPGAVYLAAVGARCVIGCVLWLAVIVATAIGTVFVFIREQIALWRTSVPRGAQMRTAVLLAFALLWASLASAHAAAVTPAHVPSEPHRTLVLCIDTSMSVDPTQFAKAKRAMARLVDEELDSNDVVWLMVIDGSNAAAHFAEIPYVAKRRSGRTASSAVAIAKEALQRRILQLEQRASRTELRDPIQMAFHLLHSRPGATRRLLAIGSDFIQDPGHGRPTALPPNFTPGTPANGTSVLLLHTHATKQALGTIGLSASELFASVRDNWAARLRALGARTTVQPVDALATP